jgi:Zn-finger protein
MKYRYFCHKECEWYPCHKNVDNLNCLFCFCPIYPYECGGKYKLLENGLKDCSECGLPHSQEGYDYIINFLKNIKTT